MKKLLIAAAAVGVAACVFGQSITAPATAVSVVEKTLDGAATTIAVTNDKPQEVWIPVSLAIDVGLADAVSTNTISYLMSGGARTYRLGCATVTAGAETLTVLSNYPALSYGDSFIVAADRATTTNSYGIGIVKTVIPR